MLGEAEKAADMDVPRGRDVDPRVQANVIRARIAGSDFVKLLRPVLFPEDDDG